MHPFKSAKYIQAYKPTDVLRGGGFKYSLLPPQPGEMIHFDEHIFQMGRNLQPAIIHPSRKADAMIPDLKLRKETAPQVPPQQWKW